MRAVDPSQKLDRLCPVAIKADGENEVKTGFIRGRFATSAAMSLVPQKPDILSLNVQDWSVFELRSGDGYIVGSSMVGVGLANPIKASMSRSWISEFLTATL